MNWKFILKPQDPILPSKPHKHWQLTITTECFNHPQKPHPWYNPIRKIFILQYSTPTKIKLRGYFFIFLIHLSWQPFIFSSNLFTWSAFAFDFFRGRHRFPLNRRFDFVSVLDCSSFVFISSVCSAMFFFASSISPFLVFQTI